MHRAEVTVIAHSTYPHGRPIVSVACKYWRAIHAEVLTHRAFARSSSGSRAIPVSKVAGQAKASPYGPLQFLRNQRGMVGGEPLDLADQAVAQSIWENAAQRAALAAESLMELGVHKQFANRVLEPFTAIETIITATEWDNFFELRIHPNAQPEIADLASAIKLAIDSSTPEMLAVGEWHLPYITPQEKKNINIGLLTKMSAARCARVSYCKHGSTEIDMDDDLALYERLVGERPYHASPLEHVAMAGEKSIRLKSPFVGWTQYRHLALGQ